MPSHTHGCLPNSLHPSNRRTFYTPAQMAAETRDERPAPAPPSPPLPVPGKRVVPEGGGEERPEPKRRRACVAALDSVPCATSGEREGEVDGHGDCSSFSFQHEHGGFVVLETTPKFGSFNPPAAAEQAALDPKPRPPAGQDSPEEASAASTRGEGEGEGKEGNSQFVGADGQGQT